MSFFRSVLDSSDIAGKVITSDAGNGDDDNAVDCADSRENNRTSAGDDERLATSTEGLLGFETENGVWDNLKEEKEMASPPMVVKEDSGLGTAAVPVVIRDRERARARIFPPLLSTLNRNGRPLFNLEMVREAGRLQIVSVPNYWPEVIRITTPGDDRMRINFISRGHKDGDVDC